MEDTSQQFIAGATESQRMDVIELVAKKPRMFETWNFVMQPQTLKIKYV